MPKTRAEVQAELKGSIAAGDVMVGDSGHTQAEIDPQGYPKPKAAPGVTRAQMKAKTLEAIRRSDIPQGDCGLTPAQMGAAGRLRERPSADFSEGFASNA